MRANQKGFTLIELLLAMAFLSFLLLFMITATLQVMRTYNKGLVLKQINQTNRSVLEEVSRTIRLAGPNGVNVSRIGNNRLCVSGTSYVWNIQGAEMNRFASSGAPVTFVKVDDDGAVMCSDALPTVYNDGRTSVLLTDRVWVQNFSVTPSSDGQLFDITISLSTTGDNAPVVEGTGLSCGPDTVGQFCAFATFTTTVNSRNGGQQ